MICLFIANIIIAQNKFHLSDLQFIVGSRYGERDSAQIEEHWTPAVGNSMLGAFKMHKNGKDVFYEFLTIEETDTAVTMRLRHFSYGLIAWEEKDFAYQYKLIEVKPNYAVFERPDGKSRLVFELDKDIYIGSVENLKDGKWQRSAYVFDKKL